MTMFAIKLAGADSGVRFETVGNETVNGIAQLLVKQGYLLGTMRVTRKEAVPPMEAAVLASQVQWISLDKPTGGSG